MKVKKAAVFEQAPCKSGLKQRYKAKHLLPPTLFYAAGKQGFHIGGYYYL